MQDSRFRGESLLESSADVTSKIRYVCRGGNKQVNDDK